ncbi:hypothetical protein ACS0TY_034890 [Phlomoides rotata]
MEETGAILPKLVWTLHSFSLRGMVFQKFTASLLSFHDEERSDNPAGNKGPAYIYPPVPKMRHRSYDAYFGPKKSPKEKTFLEPIQPYGVALNLDVPDFRNLEELIDKWMASMKIAGNILEYDKSSFISLIELSLTGSVKIGWEGAPPEVRERVLSGESRTDIVDRFGGLFKVHFLGDGYFDRRKEERQREYTQAFYALELRSICEIDKYIFYFRKYYFESAIDPKIAGMNWYMIFYFS